MSDLIAITYPTEQRAREVLVWRELEVNGRSAGRPE